MPQSLPSTVFIFFMGTDLSVVWILVAWITTKESKIKNQRRVWMQIVGKSIHVFLGLQYDLGNSITLCLAAW